MKLYSYFRSSAAFRLRIALNIKDIAYDYVAINLLAGEQKDIAYCNINPAGLVPAVETTNGTAITQSVAILEWLEDVHPSPALLPDDPMARAMVRSITQHVACDIHPLCNSGVITHLRNEFSANDAQIALWFRTWMHRGFTAIEASIGQYGGTFCVGDQLTLADVCLAPQVYNAKRFAVSLDDFPLVREISDRCIELPPFAKASPDQQPDSPSTNHTQD